MENSKKGFIITIFVLILIIIGLGGFIYYDKFYKTKEEKATLTTVDDINFNLSELYKIGDILNRFDGAFSDSNSIYLGYIYKNKLYAKDFDKKVALYGIMYNNLASSFNNKYLLGADIKEVYEDTFGKNLEYVPDSISVGNYMNIQYEATSDRYNYKVSDVNGNYSPEYREKTISTFVTKDSIVVKRKVFYVEYNSSGAATASATIYKTHDKTKKIATVSLRDGVLNTNEVIDKFSSYFNTYKYTFKQDDNGEYYFYSIEKDR